MNKINIKSNNSLKSSKSNNSLKLPPPNFITSLGAFIFYILVVLIIIPIILIKSNKKQFLLLYYPNVDLIATLLSFNGGFLPGNQFQNLYTNDPDTKFSEITTLFINYIALLGVTFLIAKHTLDKKNIYKGWSIGIVILFTTYIFQVFFYKIH